MFDVLHTYGIYYLIGQYPNGPLGGLLLTLILAAAALLLALPVGVIFALCRISPFPLLRVPVTAITYLIRGTPLLMIIFWAYFLLPTITGERTDQFTTMLAALVIFDAVYLAEIIRAGILSLPKGQMECARALGLSYVSAMAFVVLPQAFRNMLPSLVNQFVSTVKETSLGYIISLSEVSFIASQINTMMPTKPGEIYAMLGLTYFVMCFSLSRFAYWLERRLAVRTVKV